MPDFSLELSHLAAGRKFVAGVDEAGRGAWAGSLFVAMVIFPPHIIRSAPLILNGIEDSKKLSPKKRESLFSTVTDSALFWTSAEIEAPVIDAIGLSAATCRAIENCIQNCETRIDYLLLDGKFNFGIGFPCECRPKADSLSYSVAAASIVAKVLRDRQMCELAHLYPEYGFDAHKGYGTALHHNALKQYGPCPIHRRSYAPLRNL